MYQNDNRNPDLDLRLQRQWRLFLYRDEFRSHLDARDLALPAILLGGEAPLPEMLVSADELDALPDLPALIALIEARLAARAA